MLSAANALLAMPLLLAGEKDFFHIPTEDDVRLQPITREENEKDWPFSVDGGYLACAWSGGARLAMFIEDLDEDEDAEKEARYLVLSINPVDLTFLNMANRSLFAAVDSLEQLIERVGPYATVAQRLCDQPPGTVIGHGEL